MGPVDGSESAPPREVVGLFADRDSFDAAVQALFDEGFSRADLSVLASHQSIDVAGEPGTPWRDAIAALAGELKYEVPLVASGAVLLAGGTIAAVIAAIVGAGVSTVAVKEIVDEVTSTPHTEEFARSLAAGSIILWVRATDDDNLRRATSAIATAGGTNVHVHAPKTA